MGFVLLIALCISAMPAAWAEAPDALLSAVVKRGNADNWPKTFVFVEIENGGKKYVCRMDTARIVKRAPSTRADLAVEGDWAQVGVMALDAKMVPAVQGAAWLMHRTGSSWRFVVANEGTGYSKAALQKARVPASVIRTLHLETIE